MKLFNVLAASATAISTDDRAFANVPSFITGTEDWWTYGAAHKQFDDLITETEKYFNTFFSANERAQRAGGKMADHLKRTRINLINMEQKCVDIPDRKRRSSEGPSDRWVMPEDPQKALFQLFWAYAR